MSLALEAVDRIFKRMSLTYGRSFLALFDGMDMNDVKSAWTHELSGFGASHEHLKMIAWALENLPEKPLNVIEFRNLCRRAPAPEVAKLPAPKADPERVAAELAKLGRVRVQSAKTGSDGRDWARRIKARYEAGEQINPTTLRFAREGLATVGESI